MSMIAAYMEIFLKKFTNERTKQYKTSVKNAVLCGAVNELDEKHKLHG
jgi:calcineurin-like phosphoesterase